MERRKAVQRAIDYIEDKLREPISNADIARVAGYSEYHFLRVFKQFTALTPAEYIRKRRISEIVRQLQAQDGFVSELAFEYGFQSKENFCRAFKREHHILPTDFRAARNSLKLYDRLDLDLKPLHLHPELVTLDAFCVIAYASDEAYPPHFWNHYNAHGCSKRLTGGRTVEDYGVSIWDPSKGKLDYFIGVREKDAAGETAGTVRLNIPKGLYAVFETPPATCFSFVNTIHRTWEAIGREWLPQSGYRLVKGPEFETYVEDSRTFREKIYIPIAPKEQAK